MAKYDLGIAQSIIAESIGEPGNRLFRLLINSAHGRACLWMEKEQLLQLGLAIKRLIGNSEQQSSEPRNPDQEADSNQLLDLDFQISKLGIFPDELDPTVFILIAFDPEAFDDSGPTIEVSTTYDQIGELANQAIEVCAAGRPLCPLCGASLDSSGHKCPRSNGHVEIG